MGHLEVKLSSPLTASYREELARRIHFVSDDIVDFDIPVIDGEVDTILLTLTAEGRPDEVANDIRAAVTELTSVRFLPEKVLWESAHTRSLERDVFAQLVERGDAFEVGDGQVAFGERIIALLDHFDAALRSIAVDGFGAVEYRYPTLISTRALETAGYFASSPQALMFVTRLHNEAANYRAFEMSYRDAEIDAGILDHCRNVDQCLPPTMCYHTYAQHRGARLGAGEHRVVTSVGKSFRFESKYARTLERLWDFTIREIVFMGTRDDVLAARSAFMERSIEYFSELGLEGRCEVANDPFFCSADAASRVFSQRLMELKYELRLDTEPGHDIAVGSFNFHLDHFGSSFDIRYDDGGAINTSCVGFGLERVVFALLSQCGLEESGWPHQVRDALGVTGVAD